MTKSTARIPIWDANPDPKAIYANEEALEIVALGHSDGGGGLCLRRLPRKAPNEGKRRRSFERDEPETGRVDSWSANLGRQHQSAGHEKGDLRLSAGQRIGHDRLLQRRAGVEGKQPARLVVIRGGDDDDEPDRKSV